MKRLVDTDNIYGFGIASSITRNIVDIVRNERSSTWYQIEE